MTQPKDNWDGGEKEIGREFCQYVDNNHAFSIRNVTCLLSAGVHACVCVSVVQYSVYVYGKKELYFGP